MFNITNEIKSTQSEIDESTNRINALQQQYRDRCSSNSESLEEHLALARRRYNHYHKVSEPYFGAFLASFHKAIDDGYEFILEGSNYGANTSSFWCLLTKPEPQQQAEMAEVLRVANEEFVHLNEEHKANLISLLTQEKLKLSLATSRLKTLKSEQTKLSREIADIEKEIMEGLNNV